LGLGQVKPDVTAPGVAIHSATSVVGAPVASMMDPSRYISANGTLSQVRKSRERLLSLNKRI
jgi:hypothetical protein